MIIELTKLDLPGAGGAGDEQVGHLGEVGDDVAALDVLADAHDHRVLVAAGRLAAQHVAEADTFSRSAFGISMPIADLPGMGLRMRTSAEATAYAMFFDRAVTRSTLVPRPSSTS